MTIRRFRDGISVRGVARLLVRPWVFPATVVLFTLFALLFVVIVHYPTVDWVGNVPYAGTIAPDEGRHIANILYYAHRPIADGPILHDVPPQLLTMGEIERFPSYFYYYALSLLVKPLINLGASYPLIVYALRLTSVVFGVLGLFVTRALLARMGFSPALVAFTVVMVAFTGRYLWQSAAVNYDAPAATLYLVTLLFCVRLVADPSRSYADLSAALAAGFGAVITKYTFVPFVVVAVAVAVVIVLQRNGSAPFAGPFRRLRTALRRRPVRTGGLAVVILGAGLVLAERLGGNLLVYGQFNPSCAKLHTHVQCLAFDIYRRNYNAGRAHDLAVRAQGSGNPFDLLSFVGNWTSDYFQSLFFYRGRTTPWHVDSLVIGIGSLVFVAAVIAVVLSARALLRRREMVFGATIAVVYVVATFVFNVQTFVRLDNEYAFSGRYLLPVVPLIYAFALAGGLTVWRNFTPGWRAALVLPVLAVAVVVLVTYSGPVAFFSYATDPSWYAPIAQRLLPPFLTGVPS